MIVFLVLLVFIFLIGVFPGLLHASSWVFVPSAIRNGLFLGALVLMIGYITTAI